MKIIFFVFCIVGLIACTPKNYYLKPELYGQVFDIKTKKPISSREGYIGYSLNDDTSIKTDEHGRFKITPKAESYYFFRPNLKKMSASAPQIYVFFEDYEPRIVDYSNGKSLEDIKENPGARILEKVDVGIIYLEPEK
ncbi:hypothetical protein [Acinetobacter vivianii]|uniref:hypothetical protein n=1 Tax=Acinetobacter vivianii TaxID=1776742 RepID=UPI002DB887A1|nr:hypothetical protein [Acinetobacter vivianii]MEB6480096.1 hypothetical protein [Acinetobacter vivianii]MEB6658143.1 hypothetical protein [Acinetobacter vivianii]